MKNKINFFGVLGATIWLQSAAALAAPLSGCCTQDTAWTTPSFTIAWAVAVDTSLKRVYANDQTSGLIKAFNYDGTTVPAFGGGTGQVSFPMVFGVAVGPSNYPGVYAVDRGGTNSVVKKFDSNGNLVWTSPAFPDASARYICVDDNGNSYVTTETTNSIAIVGPDGSPKPSITGTGSWTMNAPTGLLMDGLNLYVADSLNDRYLVFRESALNSYSFTPTQAITVTSTFPSLIPYGMAKGPDGYIYVTFQSGYGYQAYDCGFSPIGAYCGPLSGVLNGAYGIALDETGKVYIASTSTNNVIKMNACYSPDPSYHCYSGNNPPNAGQGFIFPSPAKGDHASVSYNMAFSGSVDIKIWNSNGELATEVTDQRPAGIQVTQFSLVGFTPGVYFYGVTLKYDSGKTDNLKPKPFAFIK